MFAVLSLRAGEERYEAMTVTASRSVDGAAWVAPVAVWVCEPEDRSPRRRLFLKAVREALGGGEESPLFTERARPFVVDNESGKRVTVRVEGAAKALGPSGSDGWIRGSVELPCRAEWEGRWSVYEVSDRRGRVERILLRLAPPRMDPDVLKPVFAGLDGDVVRIVNRPPASREP
jgi:hypothetical protein